MGLHSGTFHENYAQDMAIFPTKLHWGFLLAFLIILFTCPLFLSDRVLTLLTMMGIAVISVHGLSILTGFCDQISIGHAGFMAVGGYTSAVCAQSLACPFGRPSPAAPWPRG